MTGVDSGWSEKILFHFLEMDYLVGHKPSSFTRKKKMGAINVFVSFSQFFFLFLGYIEKVLELSTFWHVPVVEIEDDVIKRMPDRHWQCQKKGANIDITSWLQILKVLHISIP